LLHYKIKKEQRRDFFSLPPCVDQLLGPPCLLSSGHWKLFPQV